MEHTSTRSWGLVERVWKVLPHEHVTVASTYSGWMPCFMEKVLSSGRLPHLLREETNLLDESGQLSGDEEGQPRCLDFVSLVGLDRAFLEEVRDL